MVYVIFTSSLFSPLTHPIYFCQINLPKRQFCWCHPPTQKIYWLPIAYSIRSTILISEGFVWLCLKDFYSFFKTQLGYILHQENDHSSPFPPSLSESCHCCILLHTIIMHLVTVLFYEAVKPLHGGGIFTSVLQPNSTEPAFQQLFNNSKIGIIYLKPGILLNSRYAISSLDLDNNSIGPIK